MVKKEIEKKKCSICYGYGFWKDFSGAPMGPMDAADGCPTKKCPECGANGIPKNSWRTLKGEYISIPDLANDHLENIIKHIAERENSTSNRKILKKMLNEQNKRMPPVEITGTVGGRTNTRKWGSKKRDIKEDQHSPKKKWQTHAGLKRTKVRWNKKRGKQEKSKKGSRERIYWSD